MRVVSSLLLAALPLLSSAAPLRRTASKTDALVLNFANVLENLETQFYSQALAKFTDQDFQSAGYTSVSVPIQQFQNIMSDEATHAKTLNGSIIALGGKLLEGCQFNFDSALKDIPTMVATARIVEMVGVGAYLGGAQLVEDKHILEAAGSILTVEARHQTILNVMTGSGTAIPGAFDIPLTPSEVLAIAGPFISGCDLGIPPNPTLTVTNSEPPAAGTLLTFSADNMPSDTNSLHCHMLVGGAVNTISLPYNQCNVPATVNGPVAIWVTKSSNPIAGGIVDRDVSKDLVAGPTIAYVDAKPEALGGLVRTGGSSNGTSTSEDISPAEASSVASSGNSSSGSSSSGGPNLQTGDGPDGKVTVSGWQNLIQS